MSGDASFWWGMVAGALCASCILVVTWVFLPVPPDPTDLSELLELAIRLLARVNPDAHSRAWREAFAGLMELHQLAKKNGTPHV